MLMSGRSCKLSKSLFHINKKCFRVSTWSYFRMTGTCNIVGNFNKRGLLMLFYLKINDLVPTSVAWCRKHKDWRGHVLMSWNFEWLQSTEVPWRKTTLLCLFVLKAAIRLSAVRIFSLWLPNNEAFIIADQPRIASANVNKLKAIGAREELAGLLIIFILQGFFPFLGSFPDNLFSFLVCSSLQYKVTMGSRKCIST